MPTIIDLGKEIKSTTPAYNDMTDLELGRRAKAKNYASYSEYEDVDRSFDSLDDVRNYYATGGDAVKRTTVLPNMMSADEAKQFQSIQKTKVLPNMMSADEAKQFSASKNVKQTQTPPIVPQGARRGFDISQKPEDREENGIEKFGRRLGKAGNFLFSGTGKVLGGAAGSLGEFGAIATSKEAQKIAFSPETNTEEFKEIFPFLGRYMDQDPKKVFKKMSGELIQAEVEVATIFGPFLKGGTQLLTAAPKAIATSKIASKFPTVARYLGYGASGFQIGSAMGLSEGLQKDLDWKNIAETSVKRGGVGAITAIAAAGVIEGTIRLAKNIASVYSGIPRKAIQNTFDNPDELGAKIKEYTRDGSKEEEIITKSQDSFDKMIQKRSTDYNKALKEVEGKVWKAEDGNIFVRNDQNQWIKSELTLKGLKENFTKTLNSHGVKGSGVEFNFDESKFKGSQEVDFIRLLEKIYKWKDTSPPGLNNLRQIIDGQYIGSEASRQHDAVIMSLRSNLDDYVRQAMPEIGDMNTAYAQQSDFINTIKREIFNPNAKGSTQINNLMRLFRTNDPYRLKILEELGAQTGTNLYNELTAAAMTEWLPIGKLSNMFRASLGVAAKFLAPGALATVPLASPRLVGIGATAFGHINQIVDPAVRSYLLNLLLLSQEEKNLQGPLEEETSQNEN